MHFLRLMLRQVRVSIRLIGNSDKNPYEKRFGRCVKSGKDALLKAYDKAG